MREIKVWGGTHGNEPLGIAVAQSFIDDPVDGVEGGIVNLRAIKLGKRLVKINMNDGYPGDESSPVYETSRAPAVLRDSVGYFATVDFHDYNDCKGGDKAFIGTRGVRPEVLGFLASIGFDRLVLSTYNSLREHVDNSFGLDIVLSGERNDVGYWREAFTHFAQDVELPTAQPSDFTWYEASGSISVEEIHPRELIGDEAPYGRLPRHIEDKLGLDGPQHWSCWNPAATEGYWAELCMPIATPDVSHWPGFAELVVK